MNEEVKRLESVEWDFWISCGGYWQVTEFDTKQNDISRDKIKAFGPGYLGNINVHGDENRNNIDNYNMLTKYEGQKVYNFQYDFMIPKYNEELVKLLREYNRPGAYDSGVALNRIKEITQKISDLGGIQLRWV